jgi:DNA-binding MltR family transcriptional regulator
MAKKKVEKEEQARKAKDWIGFLNEFSVESDRSAAILIASLIDYWLRELLQARFVDDPDVVDSLLDTERPLGSFGSRITTAFCLGLVTTSEKADLSAIKDLRNKFAHRLHGLNFQSGEIATICKKLKGTPFPETDNSDEVIRSLELETPNRQKYFQIGFVLAQTLEKMAKSVAHIPSRLEGRWVIVEQTQNEDGSLKSETKAWTR